MTTMTTGFGSFKKIKRGGKKQNKTPPHGDLTAALSRDHFSLIDCHSSKIVHLVCSRDHVTLKTMMKNIYKSRWTGSALISCKEKNTFKRYVFGFFGFFSFFFCCLSVIFIYIYIFFNPATFQKLQEREPASSLYIILVHLSILC